MDTEMEASDNLMVMVRCSECDKMVPEMNLIIHQLRACSGRASRQSQQALSTTDEPSPSASYQRTEKNGQDEAVPMDIDDDDDDDDSDDVEVVDSVVNASGPTSGLRRRRGGNSEKRDGAVSATRSSNQSNNGVVQGRDIIDLTAETNGDEQPTAGNDGTSNNESTSNDVQNEEWACPRCTLLNPRTDHLCGACRYQNPDIVRRPDEVRVERLIDPINLNGFIPGVQAFPNANRNDPNSSSSPFLFLSGGALLGGMLGAAGSMFQGRSLVSGAAEGAMSGAVGGAFLQDLLRARNANDSNGSNNTSQSEGSRARQRRSSRISDARSVAAMGMAGYPSLDDDDYEDDENSDDPNSEGQPRTSSSVRPQPRSSFRVVQRRQQGPQGPHTDNGFTTSTTIISGGNRTTRIVRTINGGSVGDGLDPLMSLLLHAQMGGLASQSSQQAPLSYEQLLEAFGDGTENMGATEQDIQRLPTSTVQMITNGDSEKCDRTECQICLEDYQVGEMKKTLPCLHSFHAQCVDKWLRTNGSCPICKHRIA